MANLNRRQFMSSLSALGMAGSLGGISALSSLKAHAADVTGYKALVMIFFKGGQDGADFAIPYDQPSWDALRSIREGMSAAYDVTNPASPRARQNLLPLNADNAGNFGGQQFAFPPEMAQLATMFDAGELAIVSGVGPLIEPVTRAQIENDTAVLPARLFSHNDQQSTWMTFRPEGARFGWGGRFADAAAASMDDNARAFSAIATGSNDPFLSGDTVQPFRISGSRAPTLDVIRQNKFIGNSSNDRAAKDRLRQLLRRGDYGFDNYYLQDLAQFSSSSAEVVDRLEQGLESVTPLITEFPEGNFASQLESIANLISVRDVLGASRQIFYVTIGGFDTHRNQAGDIPGLQARFAQGIAAFRAALLEIGQWSNTTIFTASDFGRTYIGNSSGTDHGWGNQHLVMGGAVNGRRYYGSIPEIDMEGPSFTGRRGRLIPSVSVEQYAEPLGRWFGLNDSEINEALPNLRNFNSGNVPLFV